MFFSSKIILTHGICFWQPCQIFSRKTHKFYRLKFVIVNPKFQTGVPSKASFWVGEMHKWKSCEKLIAYSRKSSSRSLGKLENSVLPKTISLWNSSSGYVECCSDSSAGNFREKFEIFSPPNSINDSNCLFYAKFVPSEISFRHFPAEIFSLKIRNCWILFLQNFFWQIVILDR